MEENSKSEYRNTDYEDIFNNYSNDEIIEVLRKRDYYQQEAAEAAYRIAIDRELIHSEADLMAPHFRVKPLKRKFIPEIKREKNKNRIRKSVGRSLLIAGLLPLIFGYLRLNSGNAVEGSLLVGAGITWMLLSTLIIRKGSKTALHLLFVLTAISAFYLAYLFATSKSLVFMDVFIAASLYFLVVYGLLFLRRIID